tara:strand:+ start:711 stop:1106 length:396 start_codon:yes stop_codon:yes gene_type:complete
METITHTTEEIVTVGDIFECSWGYDQTNIDYYEVVAVSKTNRAKLQQIQTRCVESTEYTDVIAPVPGVSKTTRGGKELLPTGYKVPKHLVIGGNKVCMVSVSSFQIATRVATNKTEALTATAHQTGQNFKR